MYEQFDIEKTASAIICIIVAAAFGYSSSKIFVNAIKWTNHVHFIAIKSRLEWKAFLVNSIFICTITCSGYFSISDFDFWKKMIWTITVLFIIKPESLLIAASLAVKHNLFIIETKTSQTDLKPGFNNQNRMNCPLRIIPLTLSLPVVFKVNSSFSISTSVQGMQCLNSENDWGIVALRESSMAQRSWPRDLWVYFEIVLKTIRKHSSIKISIVNPGYEISILVDFYSISRIR